MFEFSNSPDESYILDLAQHTHQFFLFLNGYVDNTLSNEMRTALFVLTNSYLEGDQRLKQSGAKNENITYSLFSIYELLKSELSKAISENETELSNEAVSTLNEYVDAEKYIALRWIARDSIDKAFV